MLEFHIKGLCNTCCGRSVDHVPHNSQQDVPLLAWCEECYTVALIGGKLVENKLKHIILPHESKINPIIKIPTLLSHQPPVLILNNNSSKTIAMINSHQLNIPEAIITVTTSIQGRKRKLEELPDKLGKLITDDVTLFRKLGWKGLVTHRPPRDDLSRLNILHPARRLLKQYKVNGVSVIIKDAPWSRQIISEVLSRSAHRFCHDYEKNSERIFHQVIIGSNG